MTQVYRVLRKAFATSSFDGEGAYRYGGRWSSPGTRLVYTSEHQSLAMLEYFVHLESDEAPADLVLVKAEVPSDLARKRVTPEQLPSNWRQLPAPPTLQLIGDQFVRKGIQPILIVPSALAPNENNWLLNPLHEAFGKIIVHDPQPLNYDPRMFKPQRTRRK